MISELKKSSYKLVTEVKKGWSSDKKYYIETENNDKLLMRIADIKLYRKKCSEFEMMQRAFSLGVPMSQPLEYGICENGLHVYSLFSWVDGDDAQEAFPKLSLKQQYNLGCRAGEILGKLHKITAPIDTEDWESFYGRKIDKKIEMYNDCVIKIPQGDKMLQYITKNRRLIKGRPQSFHHGDYHLGNMVLSNDSSLSVIDFNRWDFGDPWEEFNRITFSAFVSTAFAAGQIDGYFKNNVPQDFFKLMALYISVNTISSVPWAMDYGEDEVKTMLSIAEQVMNWYNDMEDYIPSWYKKY